MFVKYYRCPYPNVFLPQTLTIQAAKQETCCWHGITRVKLEDNDIISLTFGLQAKIQVYNRQEEMRLG